MDANGLDESVRGKALEIARFPSTARLLADRETLVFTSLDDPRMTDYEREDWGEYGFRSMISLAARRQDEIVGMIDIFDTRERDYNEVRELPRRAPRARSPTPCRTRVCWAACGSSNAALRELVELGDQLNEAEGLQALARIVAERLRAILEAEDCDIWGIEGDRLRCLASLDSRGWDEEEIGSERDLARLRGDPGRRWPPTSRTCSATSRPPASPTRRWRPTGAGATAAWSRCRSWSRAARSA